MYVGAKSYTLTAAELLYGLCDTSDFAVTPSCQWHSEGMEGADRPRW